MGQTSLLKDFGYKLRKLREFLKYSTAKMAGYFGTVQVNYGRYEKGKIFPGFLAMRSFANSTGISLDWLICDREPMYYKEKKEGIETADEEETKLKEEVRQELIREMMVPEGEIKDLMEHMERIPLLRHEVLVHFYKFKEQHKEK